MITKICFKCGESKPLYLFYKHPQTSDGHFNKCKECAKRDSRGVTHNERKSRSEYEKERYKTPERKAKMVEYQKNRRAANPEKYKANTAVGNALRDGRITKTTCNVCDSPKVEAHHHDYSKPLDVIWLCRKCHLKHHNKEAYIF